MSRGGEKDTRLSYFLFSVCQVCRWKHISLLALEACKLSADFGTVHWTTWPRFKAVHIYLVYLFLKKSLSSQWQRIMHHRNAGKSRQFYRSFYHCFRNSKMWHCVDENFLAVSYAGQRQSFILSAWILESDISQSVS